MFMHARAIRRLALTRLAVAVGLALPLLVQTSAAAAADDEASGEPIQRVEVRATRLGETTEGTGSYTTGKDRTALPLTLSLRETPQSVTVVTLQRMEDQGLRTVTDVVNNVTGISVNQYETSRAGFTARGFDIDNLQIDGAPATWSQGWSSGEVVGSLALYDRVDVVRGATGLMTGAGNPSAAINLVRKHANGKTLTGTVEAGVSRWNGRRLLGDVTTPLTQDGRVRVRFVGEYTDADSWVALLHNRSKTAYATIDADLTPSTLLQVGFSRQENTADGPMWGGLPYWYTDGSKTNWDVSKTSSASWARWPTSYNNAFVNLEHGFDNGWKFKATASRGDRRADSALLYLSGVPDRVTGEGMVAFAGSYLVRTKQVDAGLHLSGPFELAGRRHEAAFGYLHQKQDFHADSRAADFGPDAGIAPAVGDFNAWNGTTYPRPAWGVPTFYESSVTKQDALYGVARFSLADPLTLILGARVTGYEKTGRLVGSAAYDIKHDREVTPYAGLVYDIDRTYSVFASYTDIFQPQDLKDINGNMLDPIVGKNYEIGAKAEFAGGRLNGSLAVFRAQQNNLGQEAGLVDRDGSGPLAPETYYRAAAGATSEGFEFDLSGELAKGWNATAGYTQYRARDAAGSDVNSVYPRHLFRVFTTYRLPDAWRALTIGGGVNREGRTYTTDPAAPAGTNGLIEQSSFTLVNLMARYEIDRQWSAQLNVDNLLDRKHFGMFSAYGAITYGAPRNVNLTLKYQF